jgi:hypothetical protein
MLQPFTSIFAHTAVSEMAVRQRLVRARKRFRQIYAQESGDADINGSARCQRIDDI